MEPNYLFIGGLHRSGTSLLHAALKSHILSTGFENTGVPEDEGQHLQDVYKPAIEYGGPGKFAFDAKAHLTEKSALATLENRAKLLASWEPHWDRSKTLRLEKSPPNLIRSRFLHALFPEAKFLFIVRHPLATSFATQKWSKTSLNELMKHWEKAHYLLLEDVKHLPKDSYRIINFESFITEPGRIIKLIHIWLGIKPERIDLFVDHNANARYLKMWEGSLSSHPFKSKAIALLHRGIKRYGYSFDKPYFQASRLQFGENWLR